MLRTAPGDEPNSGLAPKKAYRPFGGGRGA